MEHQMPFFHAIFRRKPRGLYRDAQISEGKSAKIHDKYKWEEKGRIPENGNEFFYENRKTLNRKST